MSRGRKKSSDTQQLHKVAKKPGKGVRMTSQSKHIVERVRQFFEKEKACGHSISRVNVLKWTAQATGLSKSTVARIEEFLACDSKLLTPMKRYAAHGSESILIHLTGRSFAELSINFMRGKNTQPFRACFQWWRIVVDYQGGHFVCGGWSKS